MKPCLFFLFCLLGVTTRAQIIAPDTVCQYDTVTLTTNYDAVTYSWIDTALNITAGNTFTVGVARKIAGISSPSYLTIENENGTWYGFTTDWQTNRLYRIDYGSDPTATPAGFTITDLGRVNSGMHLEGIDMIKDVASGNWYGFAANETYISRLNFGTSLANTPTIDTWSNLGIGYGHQIGVQKYGTEWIGFVADHDSTIFRMDLGSSITNTPTFTALPKAGSIDKPCNFVLREEKGNYYMLVTSLYANTVSLLSFGSNLKNNTPTGVVLSAPAGTYFYPRSIMLTSDCDNVVATVFNQMNPAVKLDFGTSITNLPIVINTLSKLVVSDQNSITSFVYNKKQYLVAVDFTTDEYYLSESINYPESKSDNLYYDKNARLVFTTPGIHTVALLCNEQELMGAKAFCKDIYVKPTLLNTHIMDTGICPAKPIVLNASGYNGTQYKWNTGATTGSITANAAGKYWVKISGAPGCANGTDTINVSSYPAANANLGNDTLVCRDSFLFIAPTIGIGNTYLWSNGTVTPVILAAGGNTYSVQVTTNKGCTARDTINIGTYAVSIVALPQDTAICPYDSIAVRSNAQPTGSSYLWSTGNYQR